MSYSLFQTSSSLKEMGYKLILIDNNPDSPCLDAGVVDHICLERPTLESIEAALRVWPVDGLIHQFCLDMPSLDEISELLFRFGVPVLGLSIPNLKRLKNY